MENQTAIEQKVKELSDALKAEGLWKPQEPNWVSIYRTDDEIGKADFFEWLQFVYLPNRLLIQRRAALSGDGYIILQAKKFAGEKMVNGKIVQLLVELDALTD